MLMSPVAAGVSDGEARENQNGRSPAGTAPRTMCLIACEVSGDRNAAHLALALRRAAPNLRLLGFGGPAMRAAGVDVRLQTTDLGFIGVGDGLRVAPELAVVVRRGRQLILEEQPDLVVLVDSEFVTTPVAMWLRRRHIPAAFFFPPQVWLWGRWRLPAVRPLARRFISAFKAEAELYRAAGADTVFVGHPLRDLVRVDEDCDAALCAAGLDPGRPVVALMPGSRRTEVRALLGPILAAAKLLHQRDPNLQFALPLAAESLRGAVEEGVRASGVRDLAVYPHDSYAILSRARAVIQCSGTATLEAALLGVPGLIIYRCRRLEYLIGRHLFVDARYIGMVNILLDECVQPELVQGDVTAERLAAETWSLLTDEQRRNAIQRRLAELPALLGPTGAFTRATEALLELIPGAVRSPETEVIERADVAWKRASGPLRRARSASDPEVADPVVASAANSES
jgi:lipid-A-disaccharide synthase